MGVGYPPDALPDAPLGVRARISRAPALWVLGGEALSVRATSWGAHSGVQTLRSVRAPSLSLALLSALREQLLLLIRSRSQAHSLRGVRSICQLIDGEVRAHNSSQRVRYCTSRSSSRSAPAGSYKHRV